MKSAYFGAFLAQATWAVIGGIAAVVMVLVRRRQISP
jgi:hypothetical protein